MLLSIARLIRAPGRYGPSVWESYRSIPLLQFRGCMPLRGGAVMRKTVSGLSPSRYGLRASWSVTDVQLGTSCGPAMCIGAKARMRASARSGLRPRRFLSSSLPSMARARARHRGQGGTPTGPLGFRIRPLVAGTSWARKARFGHMCAPRPTPYRSSQSEKTQVDPPVLQTGLPLIVVPPREFET